VHLPDTHLTALALDRLSSAVLVVEESGRLVFANRMGRSLLLREHGIGLQAGRVSATAPDEDDILLEAIAAAAERGRRSVLRFPALQGEMQLTIGPLQEQGQTSRLAMISVAAARLASDSIRALREAFDLTSAESGIIAELLAGRTLNEAAAARHVSVNTARSHLRAILAKTNTNRQTQLILLLSSVLAFL
jgi:DNA-binding CsgD family transcriptional regulator